MVLEPRLGGFRVLQWFRVFSNIRVSDLGFGGFRVLRFSNIRGLEGFRVLHGFLEIGFRVLQNSVLGLMGQLVQRFVFTH